VCVIVDGVRVFFNLPSYEFVFLKLQIVFDAVFLRFDQYPNTKGLQLVCQNVRLGTTPRLAFGAVAPSICALHHDDVVQYQIIV
jgi:hypothetical protein